MFSKIKSFKEQSLKVSAAPVRELSEDDVRGVSGGDKGGSCSYDKNGTLVCKGAVITGTKK